MTFFISNYLGKNIFLFIYFQEVYNNGPCKSRIYDLSTGTSKNNIEYNSYKYNKFLFSVILCVGVFIQVSCTKKLICLLKLSLYNTIRNNINFTDLSILRPVFSLYIIRYNIKSMIIHSSRDSILLTSRP
jgi:hypothetical protein